MTSSIVSTQVTSLFFGPPGVIIAGVILLTMRIAYTILAPKRGWKMSNPATLSIVTLLVVLTIAGGLSLNMNYSARTTVEQVRSNTGLLLNSHEGLACTLWQKSEPERTLRTAWTKHDERVVYDGIVTISGPVDGECEVMLNELTETEK